MKSARHVLVPIIIVIAIAAGLTWELTQWHACAARGGQWIHSDYTWSKRACVARQ